VGPEGLEPPASSV